MRNHQPMLRVKFLDSARIPGRGWPFRPTFEMAGIRQPSYIQMGGKPPAVQSMSASA